MTLILRSGLDRPLRGVATNHIPTMQQAWQALPAAGPPAIPTVRDRLVSPAWTRPPKGPVGQYLAVLLVFLDERDQEAFETEVAHLRREAFGA